MEIIADSSYLAPGAVTPEIIADSGYLAPRAVNEDCTLEHLSSMNEEELYQYHLKIYRAERNLRLQETDKYMNQLDRFNNEQIEELKLYRQHLRDFINGNHEAFKDGLDIVRLFPQKPLFI